MGEYINPRDGSTKEQFLAEHGREISLPHEVTTDELPVCLVDNGPFTAAGIAYDDREVGAFSVPGDTRPRRWYAVSVDLLLPFMSEYARRMVGR